jgi:hypothetical protein
MTKTCPEPETLNLTIYNLPTSHELLGQANDGQLKPLRWSGRIRMLLVLAACAAPVLASYFMYYVVRPEGRQNFGDLIVPPKGLPHTIALDIDNQPTELTKLKGQWLLVAVGGGDCAKPCQDQLYVQRQLRESLGKEKGRLDRVWFVSDSANIAPELLPALAGASILRVTPDVLSDWLAPATGELLEAHLYLVDPMGDWMMRFPARMDLRAAAKAKRDIERVLRASASWDQPGR